MSAPSTSPSRILVRLPNWVGDVVMATPALRALRTAYPEARIVAEGRAFLGGLMRGLPSIDEFQAAPGRRMRDVWRRAGELRDQRFDWAVLFPDSSSSAMAPFLARIPFRIGVAREPLRRLLINRPLKPPLENGKRVPLPMVERYLRLSRAVGCDDAGTRMELALDPGVQRAVRERLALLDIDADAGVLVLVPGASFGSSKLWPPESFARAADEIADEHGFAVVLAPGPGEEPIARAVAESMSARAIVLEDPILSLEELKALLELSRLVVSNDTGPRSMAVALDKPVVVLMGPTDPRHTAMHLERQRVLREEVDCSPCHLKRCPIDHRCMTRLAPERVVSAARELLT